MEYSSCHQARPSAINRSRPRSQASGSGRPRTNGQIVAGRAGSCGGSVGGCVGNGPPGGQPSRDARTRARCRASSSAALPFVPPRSFTAGTPTTVATVLFMRWTTATSGSGDSVSSSLSSSGRTATQGVRSFGFPAAMSSTP